jgi:hypothetical protein
LARVIEMAPPTTSTWVCKAKQTASGALRAKLDQIMVSTLTFCQNFARLEISKRYGKCCEFFAHMHSQIIGQLVTRSLGRNSQKFPMKEGEDLKFPVFGPS